SSPGRRRPQAGPDLSRHLDRTGLLLTGHSCPLLVSSLLCCSRSNRTSLGGRSTEDGPPTGQDTRTRVATMPRRRFPRPVAPIAALVCLALLSPGHLAAQGLESVKAHYTKYEYRIPMRDGVRLFTAVYVPKDQTQRYPILLTRTPYGVQPYGADA